MLVRKYDCDIAFTPMIVSESFVQSQKARDSEFTTNLSEYHYTPFVYFKILKYGPDVKALP